jgi:hypothetical protein
VPPCYDPSKIAVAHFSIESQFDGNRDDFFTGSQAGNPVTSELPWATALPVRIFRDYWMPAFAGMTTVDQSIISIARNFR